MTISLTDYETLIANVSADLAFIEQHATGPAHHRILRLHARLIWARNVMDAELGVVHTDAGEPKPPANGP